MACKTTKTNETKPPLIILNGTIPIAIYLHFYSLSANQMLGMALSKYIAIGIVPFNIIKGGFFH